MGTPEFAVPSLDALQSGGYELSAVVTGPDKPRGRGRELSPTAVKTAALRHGIPVLQPPSLRDQSFTADVQALRPDLIVVVAFRILPPEVFSIAPLGAFNVHASLLPKYRGAAPINWAIINGETETGVTTFLLEEKVDTGNILFQAREPIGPEDDAGALHDRLSLAGAGLVLITARALVLGTARPVPQESSLASPAPKIFKEDCRLRWEEPAVLIHNRVRGLSPTPAAFTRHRGMSLKIYRTRVLADASTKDPGVVEAGDQALRVNTGDRMIEILEVQLEGKKRLGIGAFLRGYAIRSGEMLG